MPRSITKLQREKSIKTLTRNVFVIDARTSKEDTKHAEAALLKANPHLRTPAGFKSGATVIIPGNIRLKRNEPAEKADTTLPGLIEDATNRLKLAETNLSDAFSTSNKNTGSAMVTLKDRKFRTIVTKQSEKGADLLKAAAKNQTEQLKFNKKSEPEFAQIIKDNIAELESLRKLMKK